jgi:hypothetical protein
MRTEQRGPKQRGPKQRGPKVRPFIKMPCSQTSNELVLLKTPFFFQKNTIQK